jgi:RNA polymerase sigma-70 factor (ECF subfamily)
MDADLIKKAKTDVDAFGELYEEFYDAVYRFTYLRVNDQALCEDLVSQVWEKVLTHLHTLKSDAPEAFAPGFLP